MTPRNTTGRRGFLGRSSALALAGLLGHPSRSLAEPAPETRRIRLIHAPAMCLAPQYIAEDLLRVEGFEQIEYIPGQAGSATYTKVWLPNMIAEGIADLTMAAAPGMLSAIDGGGPLRVIAGIHAGCYELFGHGDIRSLRQLKHRRIAVAGSSDEIIFISSMLAYVGMDPHRDVEWVVTDHQDASMQMFVDRKVDAFLGFPPQPQELRARRIGNMFLSTGSDRPWSQYFCCVVAVNDAFARANPIATKRALRALLKAADICAQQPERAARYMVDKGHVADFKYALGLVTDLPYRRWRDADPEDTLRFYGLRLHEVGMIRSAPQKIIAQGTDWRFLRALKMEMKA